jgi:hypothetical protein
MNTRQSGCLPALLLVIDLLLVLYVVSYIIFPGFLPRNAGMEFFLRGLEYGARP